MEEGVSRYFKEIFDLRLGAVSGGWMGAKKIKYENDEKMPSVKEELIAIALVTGALIALYVVMR